MTTQTAPQILTLGDLRIASWIATLGRFTVPIGVASLLLIGVAFLNRPAIAAEQECFQRTELVEYLGQRAHEAQSAMGLANNGGLLEVFTTDDQSTWTILLTMPNGISCVVGAGETWMDLAQPVVGQVSQRPAPPAIRREGSRVPS